MNLEKVISEYRVHLTRQDIEGKYALISAIEESVAKTLKVSTGDVAFIRAWDEDCGYAIVRVAGDASDIITTTPINNFVCECGENRCNKKDLYCWNCEAPIAAKEPKPHLKNR